MACKRRAPINHSPMTPSTIHTTDAIVIGAGPVGLFQVFELGLLGVRAHVVDALPMVGGQCIALYPDKPIYDIPATPVCTGRELVARLSQQAAPFKATFHLHQQVSSVQGLPDGRFAVQTSLGTEFITKAIIIAAGVGAFQPRRLLLDGAQLFEGTQLFYHPPQAENLGGQRVVVMGDGDSALECALELVQRITNHAANAPASVTLMHRRDEFKAAAHTVAQVQALRTSGQLQFLAAQVTGLTQTQHRLSALQVMTANAQATTAPLDTLFMLTGLSPKLGPIADWGLAMERKQLVVNTAQFECSTPGIFAVGAVNTYPGKKKLIVCGFHEATLAAFGVAQRVFPDQPMHLEYTTTSPRLHQALGVAGV
jgi:thioredoxin reductase (NADPH)